MAVHMTLADIEEYILRLNTVLDCTMCNQITVGNITLPKAVLSTVKIFAVQFLTAFYCVKVLMISKLNLRGVAIAPACTFAAHTKVRAVTCQFVAKCLPDT